MSLRAGYVWGLKDWLQVGSLIELLTVEQMVVISPSRTLKELYVCRPFVGPFEHKGTNSALGGCLFAQATDQSDKDPIDPMVQWSFNVQSFIPI